MRGRRRKETTQEATVSDDARRGADPPLESLLCATIAFSLFSLYVKFADADKEHY